MSDPQRARYAPTQGTLLDPALPRPRLPHAREQSQVGKALLEYTQKPYLGLSTQDAYHEYIDEVAANMVQISHMGFPDLAGTYDYSTKWRRSNNAV